MSALKKTKRTNPKPAPDQHPVIDDLSEMQPEPPDLPAKGRIAPLPPTRAEQFHSFAGKCLRSAEKLIESIRLATANVFAAVMGSIFLLPVVIVVRGVSLLFKNFFTWGSDFVLAAFRVVFEVVRRPIQWVQRRFAIFNRRLLYPLVLRVQKDDTFAMVAFLVLAGLVIAGYFVFRSFAQ